MKYEKEVLECLFLNNRPMSSADIAEPFRGNKDQVSKDLYTLRVNRLMVSKSAEGYALTDKGRNYCVTHYGFEVGEDQNSQHEDTAKAPDISEVNKPKCRHSEINAGDGAITEPAEGKVDPEEGFLTILDDALSNLEQALRKKAITDLDLKLKVLKKLSELMDNSISEVLDEVIDDLTSVV